MGQNNKVVACGRTIHRNNTKKLQPTKTERPKYKPSEQPKSNSHRWADAMQQKGSRVMSAGGNDQSISFRSCEYKGTDEKPNPKYDSRCHPSIRRKK